MNSNPRINMDNGGGNH